MKKVYTTDRLILRTLDTSHASKVLDFYKRNHEFFKPWDPKRASFFFTKDSQKLILRREMTLMDQLSLLRLWLFKKDDKKNQYPMGTLAFSNILRGDFQSCFMGYKLDKEAVGNGYMLEAVTKGISIMFNEYNLHRVEANIMPSNMSSLNIVKKLGFENEGLSKKYLKINGRWEDHLRMTLLNPNVE